MARSASRIAPAYESHCPEQTLLYQIIDKYYVNFIGHMEKQGRSLPRSVQREFEDYLKCGRLEHGFLRAQCLPCRTLSRKRRCFRPSCGARRIAEGAALHELMRQWVLSFPYQLRFLFAGYPEIMS